MKQARQRFLREALAISKVDHRNVVRVLDFGFSNDTPYLAMEYLRGRDLGKLVKSTAGFLAITEVVDVMLSVCAAIRACHQAGIIHRDLKPSNVFLCESDGEREVKILDFGVSKAPIASDLTREGQILGTPQYLAPEQVDGKAVPQTDQYAIGVMLYLCLTKVLPYQDLASFRLLRAIVVGKFTPPRALRAELPEKLEGIILRAMRTVPEERFESVHALGRELWEFASPEAREQWRSYYLDDALRAPAKASTHAMPLIEAMARGIAAGTPPGDPLALAPTEPSPPVVARPPVAETTGDGRAAETGHHRRGRAERRATQRADCDMTPLIAAGALVLVAAVRVVDPQAAGAAVIHRRWPHRSRQRRRLRRQPRSRRFLAAVPVAPAAPPAPAPAVPPARQAQHPAIVRPSPTSERAPRPATSTRSEKRHRRNNRPAPSEQTCRWRSNHAVTLTPFAGRPYRRRHGAAGPRGGLNMRRSRLAIGARTGRCS